MNILHDIILGFFKIFNTIIIGIFKSVVRLVIAIIVAVFASPFILVATLCVLVGGFMEFSEYVDKRWKERSIK